jgi:hypothetical protein
VAITVETKSEIRRYLLGQLDEASGERLELRLISEPEVVEEFDVVVDELIDDYVAGELSEVDRQKAESHFLVAPERQEKLVLARALRTFVHKNRKASPQTSTIPPKRIPAYIWATAIALFVVLGLAAAWTLTRQRPTQTVALTLNITTSERGTATRPERITIDSNVGELRLSLRLPDNEPKSSNYRVVLVNADGTSQDIPVDRVNDQFVVVSVDTSTLTSSTYALGLSAIDVNKNERRLNGSYLFELVKS